MAEVKQQQHGTANNVNWTTDLEIALPLAELQRVVESKKQEIEFYIQHKISHVFLYTIIKGCILPVVQRRQDEEMLNLVPVRMLWYTGFANVRMDLPHISFHKLISCIKLPMHNMSKLEARNFNEFNIVVKDRSFGKGYFARNDKMIKLGEASKCVEFFIHIKRHLCRESSYFNTDAHSGLITEHLFNDKGLMPYVRLSMDGCMVVPLCALTLKEQEKVKRMDVVTIGEWDLTYLRFNCKLINMAGILSANQIRVVPVKYWRREESLSIAYMRPLVKKFLCGVNGEKPEDE